LMLTEIETLPDEAGRPRLTFFWPDSAFGALT
jgi:hypothetical protein